MNHDEEVGRFATAYADLISSLIHDINRIKDAKHKVDKKQELDKMDHYFQKAAAVLTDLITWLDVFGEGKDAAKDS